MSKYETLAKYEETVFRRITGVTRKTFNKMVEILTTAYNSKHKNRGRHSKLCIEDMLLATLEYLREYRTFAHIAASYRIHESNMYRTICWVEDILIKDGTFALPGRKTLLSDDSDYVVILIDGTESPIERPKKRQRRYYSGKKKRHTIKTLVVVEKATGKIVCIFFAYGKKHDFKLFKESKLVFKPETLVQTDSGFQGIQKLHVNSEVPTKRTKNNPLSKEEKKRNHKIASERVSNEHRIGRIKRFRILSERYRNRRRRFGLRFSLIAGICNFEINYNSHLENCSTVEIASNTKLVGAFHFQFLDTMCAVSC